MSGFNMLKVEMFVGEPIAGFSNVKGDYMCTCRDCGVNYYGDKRSWQCRPCAAVSVEKMIQNNFGSGI